METKRKVYETGNKFTLSTKRYELKHGKVPKETEKNTWKFRVNTEFFEFTAKFSSAVKLIKDIAEHKEYYFIELVP